MSHDDPEDPSEPGDETLAGPPDDSERTPTPTGDAAASDTLLEGVDFLGTYASIPEYLRAMLEPEITADCAWLLDHLDYAAVVRRWESDGSRLVLERRHLYRISPGAPG